MGLLEIWIHPNSKFLRNPAQDFQQKPTRHVKKRIFNYNYNFCTEKDILTFKSDHPKYHLPSTEPFFKKVRKIYLLQQIL